MYAVNTHRIIHENKLKWWVPLMEQELLTLPEHLSSPPVFSGVRVTRSLVLCVCFVDCCLSLCTFSFDHCIICSSSFYRFWSWSPLWYLHTLISNFCLSLLCVSYLLPVFTPLLVTSVYLSCVCPTCYQTWFYEDNKKAEIGNRKYWIYYEKGFATVKSGIKKRNSALKRTKIRSVLRQEN
jgi:hypothetical protein